ncbi:MAG TPA: HipA domain-containing protein [Myxococcales bacterium]|jgi:hypothetical protein|nr:HipA domain-containing protein [Myxococcales bacterium]
MAAAAPIPIRRVRRDGQVDLLGEWRPDSKELVLDQPGFPLTPPGVHQIEGELPWVFDEMCPDGFLAMQFARSFPELRLPERRELWSALDVVNVVSQQGGDLSGNLVVGKESLEGRAASTRYGPFLLRPAEELRPLYAAMIDDLLTKPVKSSVGGARPKLVLRLEGGRGLIVKYSPPVSTIMGARWADLLRFEAHAAATLRVEGIDAVESQFLELDGRGFLEIDRFDRFSSWGRMGHVTLHALGAALYGEGSNPVPVVAGLVRDKVLPAEDEDRFRRVHAFSKAIANGDTHLGNYGLLIDDEGRSRLSPAYDVLPMAFAPKHDELPDRLVKRTGPRDAATEQLVQRLIATVEADAGISKELKEAWLRVVA